MHGMMPRVGEEGCRMEVSSIVKSMTEPAACKQNSK